MTAVITDLFQLGTVCAAWPILRCMQEWCTEAFTACFFLEFLFWADSLFLRLCIYSEYYTKSGFIGTIKVKENIYFLGRRPIFFFPFYSEI